MRRAAKRDITEPEIVRALERAGFMVKRMDQPVDLLVGFRGRNYLVECKTYGRGRVYGRKTDAQVKFFDEWKGQVVILHDAQDAIDWAVSVASGGDGKESPGTKAGA